LVLRFCHAASQGSRSSGGIDRNRRVVVGDLGRVFGFDAFDSVLFKQEIDHLRIFHDHRAGLARAPQETLIHFGAT